MTEKNRYLLGVQSAKKETNPVFSKKNEKLHWLYKNSRKSICSSKKNPSSINSLNQYEEFC